ncbi:hypothetical protein PV356_09140 [Streptomyces sp. WI03-5b]|nr:hypothetical protein [Streptomyces sp. WI03-5b]
MAPGRVHETAPGGGAHARPRARRRAPCGAFGAGRSLTQRNRKPHCCNRTRLARESYAGSPLSVVRRTTVRRATCLSAYGRPAVSRRSTAAVHKGDRGCARADRTPHGRWLSVCDR